MSGDGPDCGRNFQEKRVILFLDFDGVLHPDPCPRPDRLFENAPRLARLLEEFPGVGIVLSTSWRTACSADELLERLPPPLWPRVLGVTPRRSDFTPPPARLPYRRHAECEQWLLQQGMSGSPWVALDDRIDWFAPYCEQLIACDPRIGFDARVEAQLRTTLTMARKRKVEPLDLELA